jgi:hypothetical protein
MANSVFCFAEFPAAFGGSLVAFGSITLNDALRRCKSDCIEGIVLGAFLLVAGILWLGYGLYKIWILRTITNAGYVELKQEEEKGKEVSTDTSSSTES